MTDIFEVADYKNVNAVCAVLAQQRTSDVLDLVLTTFNPAYEQLDRDYAIPSDDPDSSFASADEMLNYFVDNLTCEQTFFWKPNKDNSEWIMVGAFFTSDGYLIMSLTVPADGHREQTYLSKLKALLGSDVGTISYFNPPPFDDGADFIKRYDS